MTLAELKARATELGLTPDEVRQHGNLSKKATWEQAITEFEQWKESVDTHCEQMDIPQWSYPEDETETVEFINVTVNQSSEDEPSEELPFEPTHTLIDGKWVEIETKPVSNSVTVIHSSPYPDNNLVA